ncbi:ATP-dependent RNA helicase SrmB [Aliidiomarina minuta]|uniref:ATP-dependent RNA helicase SrmB n=1 Tax=Aliidiomarina minuta TaxID=880057 RepID=A0A432W4M9_9GAMM|nr:ATP-dependent RNA helicase SrmB [Aliidiomarina minuta]RUO24419.1 ATP-dependent RNA helicase SrmB [Aliidiomarina minuta]
MTPSWEELEIAPQLSEAMLSLGHKKPTLIQQQVVPEAMAQRDILASSPTGTGKTLAYLLPAFQHLLDFPRREPGSARVLVLAPTRELAEQIHLQAAHICKSTGHSSLLITGGVNFGSHLSVLDSSLDLIVATPGRLLDYLEQENFSAEDIEVLVLDEADRMLDMGFASAVSSILAEARHVRQRLLFSATMEGQHLTRFATQHLHEPAYIDAQPPKRERGKITQWMYTADDAEHKYKLLLALLAKHSKSVLVFVKTRERVMEINQQLRAAGIRCSALQGEMPQFDRQQALAAFSSGKNAVLVATDVAARGIDVEDVELVINYDLPRHADTYIHRIGRTGRAGRKGHAVALVEAHDAAMLGRIERYTGEKLERRVMQDLRPQFKFPDPHKSTKKKKAKKAKRR